MSGFAPRCMECGAWRRVLGRADAEGMHWRGFVTFVLAVAAVTVGFVDLQQLRRRDWLPRDTSSDAPAAAGVGTASHRTPSAPQSATSSPTRVSNGNARAPGSSTVGASSHGSPRSTAASAGQSNAAPPAAAASGNATAPAPNSKASVIADWFERVMFGRGQDMSFAHDTLDSALTIAQRRMRTDAASDAPSAPLRSRQRDAAARNPRSASRTPTP